MGHTKIFPTDLDSSRREPSVCGLGMVIRSPFVFSAVILLKARYNILSLQRTFSVAITSTSCATGKDMLHSKNQSKSKELT